MCASKVIVLPKIGKKSDSKQIQATEIFELMMLNMMDENCEKIVARFVHKDKRELSELAIWLLERRGYNSTLIPKMNQKLDMFSENLQYA